MPLGSRDIAAAAAAAVAKADAAAPAADADLEVGQLSGGRCHQMQLTDSRKISAAGTPIQVQMHQFTVQSCMSCYYLQHLLQPDVV